MYLPFLLLFFYLIHFIFYSSITISVYKYDLIVITDVNMMYKFVYLVILNEIINLMNVQDVYVICIHSMNISYLYFHKFNLSTLSLTVSYGINKWNIDVDISTFFYIKIYLIYIYMYICIFVYLYIMYIYILFIYWIVSRYNFYDNSFII
jgi:hypothetical protein